MGILGLTTFIDENQWLLEDYRLHDTKVIIDGNNIYHFLYYYFHVSHNFGGDYDVFADRCSFFFNSLKTCNVQPYVIFDGAYERNERKLKTSLKRASDRIHLASAISSGGRGKILPILAYDSFRSVLEKLNICHVTCDFEADRQVAALAVKWNCPILTNDSDFFIYDVPLGVVLLDYMNIKILEERKCVPSYHYMNVQMYYVKTMMNAMKTKDRGMLSLFATLLGNDFIDDRHFEPFFCRASLPKKCRPFLSVKSRAKIIGVLGWLQLMSDLERAISHVLSFISTDKRDSIQEMILRSIVNYSDITQSDLDAHFSDFTQTSIEITHLVSFAGNTLPEWFLIAIRRGEIAVRALNALMLRRVILLTQVEVSNEPSAYECCLSLRRYFYGILLSIENKSYDDIESLSIVEHDRDNKQLKSKSIRPNLKLQHGKLVPCLEDIPTIDRKERLSFLLDFLDVQHEIKMTDWFSSEEMKLLICVVIFWVRNAKPKVNVLHVSALLMCFLKLGIMKNLERRETTHEEKGDFIPISAVTMSKLESFSNRPHHNNAISFEGTIIHVFSQFQSCLQSTIFLNQILLFPFPVIDPSTVFNGTFLYNFYRELRSRRDPNLFMEELIGRNSSVSLEFVRIKEKIISLFPEGSLSSLNTKSVKSQKRKELKGKDESLLEEISTKDDDENEVMLTINCDLTNKFSCLELDD